MTTLPEKGEGIFGYKIMDRTTVSMLGAQITEFSHLYSGARVLYIEMCIRDRYKLIFYISCSGVWRKIHLMNESFVINT